MFAVITLNNWFYCQRRSSSYLVSIPKRYLCTILYKTVDRAINHSLKKHLQSRELAWEKWNEVDVLFKVKVILVKKSVPGYVKLSTPVGKVLVWHFWKLHLFTSLEKARGSKLFLCAMCVNSLLFTWRCGDIFMLPCSFRYDWAGNHQHLCWSWCCGAWKLRADVSLSVLHQRRVSLGFILLHNFILKG